MSQIQDFKTLQLNISSNGDNTVISAGGFIKVWKFFATSAGAVNVLFKNGTTVLGGPYILTGNGSSISLYYDGSPHFSADKGNAFIINLSGAVGLTGEVYYTQGV
jgi:hypothetical protein